jgi:hypothetical protein
MLVGCEFCGADPFTKCITNSNTQYSSWVAQYTHAGRAYAGQALLQRALLAFGSGESQRTAATRPEPQPLSEGEIVGLVERIIDAKLRTKATPARRRTTNRGTK